MKGLLMDCIYKCCKSTPANFVIDQNGIIVNEGSGLRGEQLLVTLKKILNVEQE